MKEAAQLLTRADPNNAMAWLMLAYAEDQNSANPDEVAAALDHASAAPRFHDYAFDVSKRALVASGRVQVPKEIVGNASPEEFRLMHASSNEGRRDHANRDRA